MTLPDKVQVLGIPYTIEKQNPLSVNGHDADGCITYNVQRIQIVEGMPIEAERATVMHEIMHALFKGQGQHDYQHDEALLEAVAHGVVEIMRDNPTLVAYLCERGTR